MQARTTALEATIFGVDVHSGDVRGNAPSFALVVLEDDAIERTVVTFRKLRRRIAAERPAVVATDNVYELAADKGDLIAFLEALPDETRLVQVTGAERPEPLGRVADRHGVAYGKEPMEEAEAAARLAANNVGHAVTAFTDTTQVKVARGRATGKGGWSEDRFTRRIHGAVKRRSREVRDALDDAGLSYDVDVREKYGGYANAVFTVAAPPVELPVSGERSGDVRVEIERERRDGIEFEPLVKRRDYVIIGVDPGTTTAVAVVDIEGRVLDVRSSRTATHAELIEWIIERGRPFLVAADVTPMPGTVEKLRRTFDAAGWTPSSDLLVDRKLHRTRDAAYDNDHERDAIAAALFAVDDHGRQFERIAGHVPARFERDEVIARVIAGDESVASVLDELAPETSDSEEEPTPVAPEPSPEQRRIRELEERIDRLEAHNEDLRNRNTTKDERVAELEAELSERRRAERTEVRERRSVSRLQRETDRLRRERDRWEEEARSLERSLERLKELWRLDHSNFSDVDPEKRGLVPVKPIEQFTVAAIEAADAAYGLAPNDVVLLRDASGAGRTTAERLAAREPRIILKGGGLSGVAEDVLFAEGIPVGDRDDVRLQELDELAVAREADIDAAIERWAERARRRERERHAALVDRVISEHRAERGVTE